MKNNNETGRSMLEMLAVIVVIIVLVIACMAGYDYLLQYRNRQEAVKLVDSMIVNVRSGDLARKVKENNTLIDAEEILKGPETENGVLVLPGAEHNYAVVRSMANGGFALALQLDEGTCESVLESMGKQGMTAFRPSAFEGVGANEKYTGTKSFREAAAAALDKINGVGSGVDCAENPEACQIRNGVDLSFKDEIESSTSNDAEAVDRKERLKEVQDACFAHAGRLMISVGCTGGSSADHHASDFICDDCAAGKVRGKENGLCCRPTAKAGALDGLCDGYCVCPGQSNLTDGKVIGADGVCHCQVCDPTKADHDVARCKKKYNKYAQHVCYEVGTKPDCVECGADADCHPENSFTSYGDAANYSALKDLTLSCVHRDSNGYGRCRECSAGYTPTISYPAGDNTPKSDGTGMAYCPKNRPMCNEAGVCVECPEGKKWDEVALECVCEGATYNNECVACADDVSNNGLDTGCGEDGKNICYPTEARNKDNDERYHGTATRQTTTVENSCVECIYDGDCGENKYCDSYYSHNQCSGTSAAADCPRRVYEHTYTCKIVEAVCSDDHTLAAQDTGCGNSDDRKLCVPTADMTKNSGNGAPGNICAKCFDNITDETFLKNVPSTSLTRDSGCTTLKPMCATDSAIGSYGLECKVCKQTKGSSATVEDPDMGCGIKSVASKWAGKPLCELDRDPDTGAEEAFGSACRSCKDDRQGGDKDLGCSPTAPLCPAKQANGYSDEPCQVCKNDQREDGVDAGCHEADGKPFCDGETDKYGTACWHCYQKTRDDSFDKDYGCEGGTPLCEPESGLYGKICRACQNTVPDADQRQDQGAGRTVRRDLGCPDTAPYCVGPNGASIADMAYGDSCSAVTLCSGGYYYQKPSGSYAQIESGSGYCPDGGCSYDTCGREERTIEYAGQTVTNACVCPAPAPCTDGYYYKTATNTYVAMGDYCSKTSCTAQACTPTSITVGGEAKDYACVCDAACLDGYYKLDTDGYKELTEAECSELGGCTKDNPRFRHGSIAELQLANACIAEANKCADGYFTKIGGVYTKLTTDEQCAPFKGCKPDNEVFTEQAIEYNGTQLAHACVGKPACPTNQCYHPETSECVTYRENNLSIWDDLNVKTEDGALICPCYDVVSTNWVKDVGYTCYASHPCHGYENDYNGRNSLTALSRRKMKFRADVKFYCDRYFYVEGGADDWISASSPSGIDKNAASLWPDPKYQRECVAFPPREAFCYHIYPNHSDSTVTKGSKQTVWIQVEDYWLNQIGFTGAFYFPTKEYKKNNMDNKSRRGHDLSFSGCYSLPSWNLHAPNNSGRMKIYNTDSASAGLKVGGGKIYGGDNNCGAGSNPTIISFVNTYGWKSSSSKNRINAIFDSCDVPHMWQPNYSSCYRR